MLHVHVVDILISFILFQFLLVISVLFNLLRYRHFKNFIIIIIVACLQHMRENYKEMCVCYVKTKLYIYGWKSWIKRRLNNRQV